MRDRHEGKEIVIEKADGQWMLTTASFFVDTVMEEFNKASLRATLVNPGEFIPAGEALVFEHEYVECKYPNDDPASLFQMTDPEKFLDENRYKFTGKLIPLNISAPALWCCHKCPRSSAEERNRTLQHLIEHKGDTVSASIKKRNPLIVISPALYTSYSDEIDMRIKKTPKGHINEDTLKKGIKIICENTIGNWQCDLRWHNYKTEAKIQNWWHLKAIKIHVFTDYIVIDVDLHFITRVYI